MLTTLFALILRIFSNPFSNVLQKKLTDLENSSWVVNFYTYAGLCFLCLFFGNKLASLSFDVWIPALLGGICGALGNGFLIKALKTGELSVLGPINSYKAVVGMFFGILLLGEFPNLFGILGIILIIFGTYFLFEKFSFNILKRKEIQYRVLALVFTAIEAVFIKDVINNSDTQTSFVLWCLFGTLFSFIITFFKYKKIKPPQKHSLKFLLLLIFTTGIMQYSTNYVFYNMNVSYALALFQLSTIISVLFGWKFFSERDIFRKLFGSLIMVLGAIVLILT